MQLSLWLVLASGFYNKSGIRQENVSLSAARCSSKLMEPQGRVLGADLQPVAQKYRLQPGRNIDICRGASP